MNDAGLPRSADHAANHLAADATGAVVQAGAITGDIVFHGIPGAGFGPGLVSVVPPTFRLDGALHGRADLIRTLVRAARAQCGVRVVMHGLGGSGKTTAALAFAARMARDHKDIRVWWLDASAEKTLRAGAVVITTRDGRPDSWGDAELHGVGPLDEDEAVALLRDLAPDGGTGKQARDLARTLANLPLTLHLAGRYLDAAKSLPPVPDVDLPADFDSYRLTFRSDFGTLDELHGLDRTLGPRELLTRTWEFTLDLLRELGHPLARPLLRRLSCFAQAPIPYTLLDWRVVARSPLFAGATGKSLLRTLVVLEKFGLVEDVPFRHTRSSSVTTKSLHVHPVIREANLHQPDFARDLRPYVALAVAVLDGFTSHLSAGVPEEMSRWAALSPHCATKLTCAVARFAQVTDAHARAESLFKHARVGVLGEDHPEVLGLRRELAWLHWNSIANTDTTKFRQSVDEYAALAEQAHAVLGEQDPLTLRCRFELALIRSHDAGGPAVADHNRDVVRLGSEVFGRVELIGFTAQLSLVGHLWRRMHRRDGRRTGA